MKSPSSSVGIIESEGMRNGSNRNERISSTMRITGKNERAYSTTIGSRPTPPRPSPRRRRSDALRLEQPAVDRPDDAGQGRGRDQDEREIEDHAYFSLPTCN